MTNPIPTDWRALCAELAFCWSRTTNPDDFSENAAPIIERMTAALAQPEPQGPTDEKLLELMPETMRDEFSYAARTCAVLTFKGKRYYLGTYEQEIDAARAYNKAALAIIGDYALINELSEESNV
jgi:hypothetical protein